jgi:hypothetical protein
MKTTRRSLIIAGVLLGATATRPAGAGMVTVSINNEGSFSEHAVTVTPGDTFRADINVHNLEPIFDMYDLMLLASDSGVLSVVGGDIDPGVLDPESHTFGWVLPFPQELGPGDWTLGTVELLIHNDAVPDVYALSASGGTYTACRICPAFGFADPGPDFIVTIVPEPTTALLVLSALAGWLHTRRSATHARGNDGRARTRGRRVLP